MEVLFVRWRDAAHREEMEDGEEAAPIELTSVGWAVSVDEESVVIAQERDEVNGCWRHVTTIPRGLVTQIDRIWQDGEQLP